MSEAALDNQQEIAALRHRVSELEAALAAAPPTSPQLALAPDHYSILFNLTQDMIFVHTLGTGQKLGRFTDVNNAVINTLGYSKAELLELTTQDIILNPLDDIEKTRNQLLQQGSMLLDVVLVTKDGAEIPVELHAKTYTENNELYTISIARNITEQRQLEEAYRSLLDNSLQGTVIFRDGRPIFASNAVERITGYTVEEYLALSDEDLWATVHPDDQKRIREYQRARLANDPAPDHYEYRVITKYNELHWVEIRASNIEYQGRPAIQGTFIDISERKKAKEALEQLASELMLINDVSSKITSELSLEMVLEHAAQLIHDTFGYEHIGIFMLDEVSEYLIMRARAGEYEHLFPKEHRLKLGQGMVGSSAAAGEPILANDVSNEPRFVNPFAPEQVTASELSVPLRIGGDVLGVLDVQSREFNAFQALDIMVLETLADGLASAIHNASLYAQVQQHAEELEERVDVRTAELAAAVERLEELARVKDDFIAKVSHELRTPLTNLKLYHDLLEMRPERHGEYLQTLKRETARLYAIVENLLYVSRMDRGLVSVYKSQLNIETVLLQYINDRRLLAENRGLTLSFEKNRDVPTITADLHLIEQLIGVLLTNAINYTPIGGLIVVKTKSKTMNGQQWAGFSITDNGPGISAAEQERIFERFFRGAAAADLAKPGTGLGLTIAQDIIDHHQGHLEVFSDGIPGKGTTFTAWLPVK